MSTAPLYKRDPEAWQAHLAEDNRTQARKRVVAELIYRDDKGRILLVDPPEMPDWDLPGGLTDEHEPPLTAATRFARAQLGLDFDGGRLLVLDWMEPHGVWDDSLHTVFDGGVIDDPGLPGMRFWTPGEAGRMLRSYVWRRVQHALAAAVAGTTLYLHNGRLPGC